VEFDFLDVSGGNANGHMNQDVFKIIDANHHTEGWTYSGAISLLGRSDDST